MAGVIQQGPNKDRFKQADGSRFKGCVETQVNKGLSPEAARRLCAFIARKQGG
jgi:hypothetical protein